MRPHLGQGRIMKSSGLDRRAFVRAGFAASSLFVSLPYARVWAQSEGTLKLLRLPKIALVVGNGKYKDVPLRNPANDARAIGDALKAARFAVTAKLDVGRAEMVAALEAYAKELAVKKCVGLFYYAGHGVQLAWRNYMLPVDVEIETIDDVQTRAVEVDSLIQGLTRAGNPLNIVILDACRDNPFGTAKALQQKGLSQMDAPANTILAYATAPGSVASDGDGANGLYTENLLREIKVPEAKVEDVFKRVRLNVRRKSHGAQIPWESTSLEEDFWFIPPKELKKLSDADRGKRFDEELQFWESVKGSKRAGPLEDYLRRYPNGEYSELAQLELDTVLAGEGEKRVEMPSQSGNPFTQGFARADTNFKIGDFYSYRLLDLATGAVKRAVRGTITSITDQEVIFGKGVFVLDRMGNTRKSHDGWRFTDNQHVPLEFYVGKKWTTVFRSYPPGIPAHIRVMSTVEYKIAGREKVEVPAGSFNCFKIEGRGQGVSPSGRTDLSFTAWYAPERCRRVIAQNVTRTPPPSSPVSDVMERWELTAFKQT
jgi:Caspase domain